MCNNHERGLQSCGLIRSDLLWLDDQPSSDFNSNVAKSWLGHRNAWHLFSFRVRHALNRWEELRQKSKYRKPLTGKNQNCTHFGRNCCVHVGHAQKKLILIKSPENLFPQKADWENRMVTFPLGETHCHRQFILLCNDIHGVITKFHLLKAAECNTTEFDYWLLGEKSLLLMWLYKLKLDTAVNPHLYW